MDINAKEMAVDKIFRCKAGGAFCFVVASSVTDAIEKFLKWQIKDIMEEDPEPITSVRFEGWLISERELRNGV